MSAYACEPGRGSEPGIGWNIAKEVAKHCQVWVLTSNTHRPAIEAEIAANPIANLKFIYLDPLGWVYDWSNEGQKTHWAIHLHYYLWQIQAYTAARQLIQDIKPDLIHHVTYGKYWGPSFLSLLPVPFIWGPVGGGEFAPNRFWQDFSLRGRVYEIARAAAQWVGECDPFTRLTAKRSKLALAATEETAERLRQLGAKTVEVFSNAGLPKEDIDRLATCKAVEEGTHSVRFVSIGRLLHWKGIHLGLRAFAKAQPDQAEYWIIGDGPERKGLEALANQLNIADKVRFWGSLSRGETLSRIQQCHALVHPSLHDSGGWVCAEMMAAGRPVLCLDLGGPGVQVTEETGIKVAAIDPEQAINGLAEAMTKLVQHPELQISLGQAGQKRVYEQFDWTAKGRLIVDLYEKTVPFLGTPSSSPPLVKS